MIEDQWHAARWAPGISRLVMDGEKPARVADEIIDEIKSRGHAGLVELPWRLQPGDRVRVSRGPLTGLNGLCVGQS